jgi:hypothetical protein
LVYETIMSVEFIEDLVDARGVEVGLSMNVHGYAALYVGDLPVFFQLAPTEEGLRAAERIEAALSGWREAVSRLREARGEG